MDVALLDDVEAAGRGFCFGTGPAIGARRFQVSAVTRARITVANSSWAAAPRTLVWGVPSSDRATP
ncbi:hypothetical protein [Streptomyces sp. NPDC056323]|uniref:hypothetical protein n=1 Tax=Streptomyces sp. NPDC056323 TaxID=3345784 RepID=UPI0035D9BA86